MYRYDVCIIDSCQPDAWYLALAFACARSRVVLYEKVCSATVRARQHIKNDLHACAVLEQLEKSTPFFFQVHSTMLAIKQAQFLVLSMPLCSHDGLLLAGASKLLEKIASVLPSAHFLIVRQPLAPAQLIECKAALKKLIPGVCIAYCPFIQTVGHPLQQLHQEPQLVIADNQQQAEALKRLFAQLTDTVTVVYTHHYLQDRRFALPFAQKQIDHNQNSL